MNMQNPVTLETSAYPNVDPAAQFRRDLIALIPHLRAFSRTLCGRRPIAEDMAQEALAKAWRAQKRFEPGTNLKAWLFTILRNEFYSHSRRAWRESRWDPVKGERIAGPRNEQEWALEFSDTARALRKLPKQQREALILVAASGFSYNDAATICGVPAGTVKSRVARGRAALVEALDGHLPKQGAFFAYVDGFPDAMLERQSVPLQSGAHVSAALYGRSMAARVTERELKGKER